MSKNRLVSRKITIFCEGKTEELYLKNLFSNCFIPSKKYNLKSDKKNSYKHLANLIEKSDKLYDIIIVIMDLDRATDNSKEYEHLQRLIKTIKKKKNESHIFLTYSRFEDWLGYHFKDPIPKEKLPEKLGCKDSQELKSKENLYQIIQNKGGDIKNAEKYFKTRDLFCNKELKIFPKNKNSLQSNLYYFRDHMSNIGIDLKNNKN